MTEPKHNCDLIVNAMPKDYKILSIVARNIVHQCNFPFRRKILVVDLGRAVGQYTSDDFPVGEDKEVEPSIMSHFDEVLFIGARDHERDTVLRDCFAGNSGKRNDHRGGAIYQYLKPMLNSDTDFICHFDCDILIYARNEFSWVNEGIELLKHRPEIFAVVPHSGPPCTPNQFFQPGNEVIFEQSIRLVNAVSSRKFLIDRGRFLSLLPLTPLYASRKLWVKSLITRQSALLPLEMHLTCFMRENGLWRADLSADDSWSVHCPDRLSLTMSMLPKIVRLIELGVFPDAQRGRYDLELESWSRMLCSGLSSC